MVAGSHIPASPKVVLMRKRVRILPLLTGLSCSTALEKLRTSEILEKMPETRS